MRAPTERVLVRARLDDLLARASATADDATRALLAQYACVVSSGLIECTCREVLAAYARRNAHPAVATFVERRLNDFQTANTERLKQLLESFGRPDYLDQFDAAVAESINSIVNTRHSLAHGRSTGISLGTVKQHQQFIDQFLRQVERDFTFTNP